jgi:hypothetical protein
MLMAPRGEVRREGLDLMLDVLVGAVMFGVLSALVASNFFVKAVYTIASSVSVGNQTLAGVMPDAGDPQQLLGWSKLHCLSVLQQRDCLLRALLGNHNRTKHYSSD